MSDLQSDVDTREITDVMHAWEALHVLWKRSSRSMCILEMEGKKYQTEHWERL